MPAKRLLGQGCWISPIMLPSAPLTEAFSLAQYSRRIRGLGLLPDFLFFVALVMTRLRLGVIRAGSDPQQFLPGRLVQSNLSAVRILKLKELYA